MRKPDNKLKSKPTNLTVENESGERTSLTYKDGEIGTLDDFDKDSEGRYIVPDHGTIESHTKSLKLAGAVEPFEVILNPRIWYPEPNKCQVKEIDYCHTTGGKCKWECGQNCKRIKK